MVGFGITEHPYKRGPTSQLKKNRGTPTEFEGGDPREGYYDSQMVKNNLGYGRLPAAVLPPANYGTALAYDPNNAVRTYAPDTGFSAPLSAIDQATQVNGRPVDEYGFYVNSNPVATPADTGGGFFGGILSGALDQASALKDNVVSGVQQVAQAAPVLGGKVVDAVQENIMSDPGKMLGMLGPMLQAKMAGMKFGGGRPDDAAGFAADVTRKSKMDPSLTFKGKVERGSGGANRYGSTARNELMALYGN